MSIAVGKGHHAIDSLFLEERLYPPPGNFAGQANAKPGIYERDFEGFWESEGRERVTWFAPFEKLYEWDLPYAKWYPRRIVHARIAQTCRTNHVADDRACMRCGKEGVDGSSPSEGFARTPAQAALPFPEGATGGGSVSRQRPRRGRRRLRRW
jgi:hypothetical protein